MKKEKKNYRGVQIIEIVRTTFPVEATVAFNHKRLVFRGIFTIDQTSGSWKFGPQLQFVLWTREAIRQENRAENNGCNRIEIALPLKEGLKLLKECLREGFMEDV